MNVDWSAVGSVSTSFAVFVAAWQVRKSTQQAQTNFEDELSREYRDLARSISVKALLGAEVPDDEFDEMFPVLYRYLDLSNEQAFLRRNGRIRRSTWENWKDGIRSNLRLPAFEKAWMRVKASTAASDFEELRTLEKGEFRIDPRERIGLTRRIWERVKS